MGDFQEVYCWIDEIPLSRPKKNISRDFSDGVLFSEVIHHFFPGKIDLHNYISTNSVSKKTYNWNTLNRKVLKKVFGYEIPEDEIKSLVKGTKGFIEKALLNLKAKVQWRKKRAEKKSSGSRRQPPRHPLEHGTRGGHGRAEMPRGVQRQGFPLEKVLGEKENIIEDLRETVAILQLKIQKLEQLLALKDKKIHQLSSGSSR
ncbi:hypothetical protein AAMO2058_001720000 [Amorphochlora amoebiformis]